MFFIFDSLKLRCFLPTQMDPVNFCQQIEDVVISSEFFADTFFIIEGIITVNVEFQFLIRVYFNTVIANVVKNWVCQAL